MAKRILSPLLMSFLVFILLTGGLHLNAVEKHVVTTQKLRDAVITSSAIRTANIKAIEDIELLTKCNVQVFVSTMTDITDAINKLYAKEKK